MNRGGSTELWRIVFIALAVLLLSIIFGEFFVWLALAGITYLTWHLHNLFKLLDWLDTRLTGEAPRSSGVWEDIFLHLFSFRQRNKRRHKRLVTRISRFQEAAQALPNAIIVLNNQGVIEWCNNSATRMLGIHTSDDLGQRILNLVRTPALVDYIKQATFDEALKIVSPMDEAVSLSIRIVPYGSDQHLLLARDISRVQRLEETRRDFVANVSHEMRTPLTVINGYLELLSEADNRDSDDFDDVIVRMTEQASRLQSIIGDLLMLSRLEAEKYRPSVEITNVPALLKVMLDDARSLSGFRNHVISLECDDNLFVRGNEQELRSAFSNLVFNAVNYTPVSGEIALRWYQDENGAHFSVRDSGIGIPKQHIVRLTERFYRVDIGRSRHSGGTGLGLAIVKHVLQRHDATLHIESELDKGSVFRCDFGPSQIVTETNKLS